MEDLIKKCNACNIEKPINKFHKAKKGRHGVKAVCKSCRSINEKDSRDAYYFNNKENILESQRKYKKENPDVIKATVRRYKRNNKGKVNADTRLRQTKKINATPIWVDKNKIKKVYEMAQWLENLTGLKYHVDHIIPLRGKNVCGLHCWNNLQILEASINESKGNKS